MSYASNDEIRGVLIQAGNERVLLPNATVAEMMSRVPVQPVSDAPRWLVGEIGWHGWQVPLVSFQFERTRYGVEPSGRTTARMPGLMVESVKL